MMNKLGSPKLDNQDKFIVLLFYEDYTAKEKFKS